MASSHSVCRLCLIGIEPQEVSLLNSNQQLTQGCQVIFSKICKFLKICLEKSGSPMPYMENLTNYLQNLTNSLQHFIWIFQTFVKWDLKNLEYSRQIWKVGNAELTKSIFHITGIEVASDSGQHEYLCNRCESELGQCVQFRTTCIHNNDIFKKMLHEGNADPLPVATNVEVEFLKVEVDIADEFNEKQSNSDPQDNDDGMDPHSDVENEDEGLIEPMVEEKVKEPRTRKKRKSKTDNDVPKTKKSYWKSRKNAHKVQCQQCGAMIAHYNLKSHQEIHNPNRRKLTCPHCPKEFICRKTYKIHVNAIHTQEIKYTCDKCGKVYLRPHSLKEHILASHTDEKRYQCKQCGERFPRSAMRNHHEKKVHSTARPFACEYCDKTFKFKTDFTVHTRIHTGEKPYKCDICGKCFNKSYNVVIHKKSHRND